MIDIKFCEYNHDTGSMDVTFADGHKMAVLCNRIEDTLDLTPTMQSKYDRLIFNEPETFAELALSDELLPFLERYAKSYHSQEGNIRNQLEKYYPLETAREIAREFMMYNS